MKKFLLSLVLMTFAGYMSAQSLTFKYEGEPVEPGTIDIVSDVNDAYELVFDLHVTNTTENPMNVVWEMNDTVSGTRTLNCYCCCFDACYGPTMKTNVYEFAAGQEGTFEAHVSFANEKWELMPVGTAITVIYTFYDERNADEKYTFTVNFKYQPEQAIEEVNTIFSNAYPNPANNTVSFDYEMQNANSASVAIYNMMGQEVVRQDLNLGGSRVDINVSDLNEGVYFYSLIVNNQTVKTNKFVVSR